MMATVVVLALAVAGCGSPGPKALRTPSGDGGEWVVTDATGHLVSIADDSGIPPDDGLDLSGAVTAIDGRGDAVRLWLWRSPCPAEIRVGLATDGAGMAATVSEVVSCGQQSADLRILRLVFDGPIDADAFTLTDLGVVPAGE
jgi:hypothetical protein